MRVVVVENMSLAVGAAPTSRPHASNSILNTRTAGQLPRQGCTNGSSSFTTPISTCLPAPRCASILRASPAGAPTTSLAVASNPPVKAILFDMDGVLCNSEIVSRKAAAEVMKELYSLDVSPDEFIPYTGTGEANFLGGVARKYGAPFEVEACKEKFFEIYMRKYAIPGAGIGYPGAKELVAACRAAGLRTAVASSADLVKVHANLSAADIPLDLFDTIVSADAFENLKPFPDIFLAASAKLGVDTANCVVIEDAVAGVQAARAAGMRVIGVVTTLEETDMEDAGPDQILPQINKISVDILKGLKLREGGIEAIVGAMEKFDTAAGSTATCSNTPASPVALVEVSGTSSSSTARTSTNNTTVGVYVQDWLNGYVSLPAGYKTTRRDALKFISLGGAFGSGYVALSRAKSLSYASPKALLNALLPQPSPTSLQNPADAPVDRVAAFKRFISDMENRGGGESVPEFPLGADWLNCPPLRLDRELRGKVVLLDFWTYCCINCMHILPDLAYLENKFQGKAVTVVGVHSAKFDNEKDTGAIRDAVLRYDIRHPVINDKNMELWRALGVSSWPTVAVVSPTGKLIVSLSGEDHRRDLDDILTAALEYYGENNMLDAHPVPESLEKNKDSRLSASPLRFPGKIALDAENNRLIISDSGNHRIVVTEMTTGKFLAAYGGNGPGLRNGEGNFSAFNRPQGLAYSPTTDSLFVCDTENHAIREIQLKTGEVRTVVGDGVKGENDFRGGAAGAEQRLNSPWDCLLLEDGNNQVLLVAMAGQHQIWRVDVATGVAAAVSGNGSERNQNGSTGLTSAWAQPSGLALVPKRSSKSNTSGENSLENLEVLVADSESSTIRRLNLSSGGASACVGGDPLFSDNLFKFGDEDGVGANALLQHPLAVASSLSSASSPSATTAWVADSYNHRLKILDTTTCSITTVAGTGQAGFIDGIGTSAQLSEPGGLAVSPVDGRVFIADTNNSLIRVFDPRTSKVSTLQLQGVPKPAISPDAAPVWTGGSVEVKGGIPPGAILVKSSTSLVISSEQKVLNVRISLPPGYHLTQGANSRFECSVVGSEGSFSGEGEAVEFSPKKGPLQEVGDNTIASTISLNMPSSSSSVSSQGAVGGEIRAVRVLCTVYFCQDKSVCLFKEIMFEVPLTTTAAVAFGVELGSGGNNKSKNNNIDLMYTLPAERTTSSSLPVV
ncbi:hypothetical protein Ndes2526B_g06777 [Nannochloris sp. 'desiccata']